MMLRRQQLGELAGGGMSPAFARQQAEKKAMELARSANLKMAEEAAAHAAAQAALKTADETARAALVTADQVIADSIGRATQQIAAAKAAAPAAAATDADTAGWKRYAPWGVVGVGLLLLLMKAKGG